MKIYISGPMTGYPMKNKPMFDRVEKMLKSLGYDTVNPTNKPTEILHRDATQEEYLQFMKEDIFDILYKNGGVDMVATLSGWEKSNGAKYEVATAKFFKLPVIHIREEELEKWEKQNT